MGISKGIKLRFGKAAGPISSEFEIYNSTNRIPFSLKIDCSGNRPSSIYCELFEGGNFIEFWFNKETKKLYEVTIVSIQEDTVKPYVDIKVGNDDFYECFIEDNSELQISTPVQISRTDKSLSFSWGEQVSRTYPIAKNCILGTNHDGNLCCVSLTGLNEDMIHEILGF